jgi:acetyltransferase
VARNADEAVEAARGMKFPVVLKLLSSTITHKSDVGGVQLGLRDEEDVRRAFDRIQSNLAERGQAAAFEGVTVQPMLHGRGYELIVGSSLDPLFGPTVLFGAGGVLVEILKDNALALPPLTRTLARRLIERTRIHDALKGTRGLPAAPLDDLELLLVRFSRLVADVADVAEIEINPLIVQGQSIVAVDARATLVPAGFKEAKPPSRLAIRPYPNQYDAPFRLADGKEVMIRAIRPEDEPLIVELHARHSDRTLWMRFFSLVRTLSRESLIRFCHLDYDRELALVAVATEADGRSHIVGVSRYYVIAGGTTAEFALVVTDDWQGKGLGRHLLERLITAARERGIRQLNGSVLRENQQMLRLVQDLGFVIRESDDPAVIWAELNMSRAN